jgi:hypothetical protein
MIHHSVQSSAVSAVVMRSGRLPRCIIPCGVAPPDVTRTNNTPLRRWASSSRIPRCTLDNHLKFCKRKFDSARDLLDSSCGTLVVPVGITQTCATVACRTCLNYHQLAEQPIQICGPKTMQPALRGRVMVLQGMTACLHHITNRPISIVKIWCVEVRRTYLCWSNHRVMYVCVTLTR